MNSSGTTNVKHPFPIFSDFEQLFLFTYIVNYALYKKNCIWGKFGYHRADLKRLYDQRLFPSSLGE